MGTRTTRRAFVGGGVALAAGGGLALAAGAGGVKLPELAGRATRSLALEVDQISASGSAPAFGTLLPVAGQAQATLSGRLRERNSARVAGRITMTSIPSAAGIVQVHTLDLSDGTVVALGPDTGSAFTIASGTGAFAGATGSVVVRGAATATPSVDVDLEL